MFLPLRPVPLSYHRASTQIQRETIVLLINFTSPSHPHRPKYVDSALEAVSGIKSGQRVVIQGAVATPVLLVEAMTQYGKSANLKDVQICHLHTEGPVPYVENECLGIFHTSCFFVGSNMRKPVAEGRAEYGTFLLRLSVLPSSPPSFAECIFVWIFSRDYALFLSFPPSFQFPSTSRRSRIFSDDRFCP